VAHSDTAVSNK